MTDIDTSRPESAEQNAERTRELLLESFDVLASNMGRALTITALAATEGSGVTATSVTHTLNGGQGSSPGRIELDPTKKTIKSYLDFPFTKRQLVTRESVPRGKYSSDIYRLTDPAADYAAAMAGELIRVQLKYPNIPVSLNLDANQGNNGLSQPRTRLRVLEVLLYNPEEFTALSTVVASSGLKNYGTVEDLFMAGFLQRRLQSDMDLSEIEIQRPKTYAPSRASDLNRILHDTAMDLLNKDQSIVVTVRDLLAHAVTLHPQTDPDALRIRFSSSRPNYIKTLDREGLSKSTDKVAVRIAPGYLRFVTELLESINRLANSAEARIAARDYGRHILANDPEAMTELMCLAFAPKQEASFGVIAAQNYGQDGEQWRPTVAPRPRGQTNVAELAISASPLKPSGRVPLTNKMLSEILERLAGGKD